MKLERKLNLFQQTLTRNQDPFLHIKTSSGSRGLASKVQPQVRQDN